VQDTMHRTGVARIWRKGGTKLEEIYLRVTHKNTPLALVGFGGRKEVGNGGVERKPTKGEWIGSTWSLGERLLSGAPAGGDQRARRDSGGLSLAYF